MLMVKPQTLAWDDLGDSTNLKKALGMNQFQGLILRIYARFKMDCSKRKPAKLAISNSDG
jgi:hypothetical protein